MNLNPDTILRAPLQRDNHALHILVAYIRGLQNSPTPPSPSLAATIASHICDLAALALGASDDVAHRARHGGLRQARLQAIKADIATHIGPYKLRIDDVAKRQGISPAYVRKLFEMEETNFSAYCLKQRLERAYHMLRSPRFASTPISDIAYAVGFNDLSYFNRTFRTRFDATPSDVRQSAVEGRSL